jgi:hypothetical protein
LRGNRYRDSEKKKKEREGKSSGRDNQQVALMKEIGKPKEEKKTPAG